MPENLSALGNYSSFVAPATIYTAPSVPFSSLVATPAAAVVESSLDRLKRERAEFFANDRGTRDGRDWATTRAKFEELSLLEVWWGRYRRPANNTPYFLFDEMVIGMHPGIDLMNVYDIRNEIFNCYGDNKTEGVKNDYTQKFILSALQVLREISTSEGSS